MKFIKPILKSFLWFCRLIVVAFVVLMILGTIYQAKENFKRNGTSEYARRKRKADQTIDKVKFFTQKVNKY